LNHLLSTRETGRVQRPKLLTCPDLTNFWCKTAPCAILGTGIVAEVGGSSEFRTVN
jgi:hypothetical protein